MRYLGGFSLGIDRSAGERLEAEESSDKVQTPAFSYYLSFHKSSQADHEPWKK